MEIIESIKTLYDGREDPPELIDKNVLKLLDVFGVTYEPKRALIRLAMQAHYRGHPPILHC